MPKQTKYYYAIVLYRGGRRPDHWRFTSPRKRSSAVKAFKNDPSVLDIKLEEKME